MAKLAALSTFFAVLLLVANAYAYRTTITTVEFEKENKWDRPGSQQQCREEIQQSDLSDCEQYITQSRGQGRVMMMIDGANPQRQSQSLQQCCNQMKQLDDKCQCSALKQIVQEGQQQGRQGRGKEQTQMVERAQTVVSQCNLPQRCEWQSVWF
ncbi:hypothetical protein Ddye_027320 [Dipteronia dyeriana]|uniref:Bifunctional inhibitor/plant lipid transfer protein/seed storage helical domain-containing protein n=1 Tax=Dipteronia dyeriana TaxID=168575 RepID=A0AAD9WRD2_9ROSI|nr:hypothetical protein Ddye_027320 [Dipteronia dyeriana]